MNPLISIIIPIYNREKYIEECLNSILSQTFNDYEILLIDDGSNDNTGIICDKYAEENKKIKVFHKKNGGVSSARNLGLRYAKGKWIIFVDSDDMLAKESLTIMNSIINKINYTADVIVFEIGYSSKQILQKTEQNSPKLINYLDEVKGILKYELSTSPCAKIFRSEIAKTISFDEQIRVGEDAIYNLQFMLVSKKSIPHYTNIIYYQRVHSNSIMHQFANINTYEALNNRLINLLGNNELFKKELSYSIIINTMQPLITNKIIPTKNQIIIALENLKNIDNIPPMLHFKYLKICMVNKTIADIYLKIRYIRNFIKKHLFNSKA